MSATYNISLYRAIDQAERKHFWFNARNRLLSQVIGKFYPNPKQISFLEVGCGTGIVIRELEKLGFRVTGLDVNDKALAYAKIGTQAHFIRKSFYVFNPNQKYAAIGMFDVLEHQRDDLAFLKQSHRLLKNGGRLFLTVPASQSLWNEIDDLSGHQRRYEKDELIQVIKNAGFEVEFVNYWQFVTLPFYMLWRLKWRPGKVGNIDNYLKSPWEPLNRLLLILLSFEQLFTFKFPFPQGASLILVARKPLKG
jgi:SAM-dependent methyltransferase